MLQRVRDLKVQFDNGTLDADDKDAIARRGLADRQGGQRASSTDTKFNGKAAVRRDATFTFQVGANDGETITTAAATSPATIGAGGLASLTEHRHRPRRRRDRARLRRRSRRSPTIDDAIKNVSKVRANFGAVQNRLEHRLTTWRPTRRT